MANYGGISEIGEKMEELLDAQSFCRSPSSTQDTFPEPFSVQSRNHKAIASPANASTAPAKEPNPPEAAPMNEEVVGDDPGT